MRFQVGVLSIHVKELTFQHTVGVLEEGVLNDRRSECR